MSLSWKSIPRSLAPGQTIDLLQMNGSQPRDDEMLLDAGAYIMVVRQRRDKTAAPIKLGVGVKPCLFPNDMQR